MPDEPTGYELFRSIEALRGDVRDGNAAINQRLDRLVSVEAHAADMRRVDERLAEIAQDLVEEREGRRAADKELRESQLRMENRYRVMAASIALPIALFVGNIVLVLRAGGG